MMYKIIAGSLKSQFTNIYKSQKILIINYGSAHENENFII